MIDHQMEHILVKRNNLDSSNALSTCLIKRSPLLHARHACHQGMRDRDPFANTIRRMNAPRHWMQLRLNELQMQTQCKKSNTQNQVNASHGMKYSPPPKTNISPKVRSNQLAVFRFPSQLTAHIQVQDSSIPSSIPLQASKTVVKPQKPWRMPLEL